MKNIILILSSAFLLSSCGSKPHDPIRTGAAAVGAEADRREREQAQRDQFFENQLQQRKRDQLSENARKITDRTVHENRPAARPRNFQAPQDFYIPRR